MRPGSVTSIVLSSKALLVVEWCLLIAPLCCGERGAGKGKSFKQDQFSH